MKLTNKQSQALKLIKEINPLNSNDEGTQIILAVNINNLSIFYCKYCNKNHKHGLGNGYRSPHCFKGGYRNFGDYYLIIYEPEEVIELFESLNKPIKQEATAQ